MTRIPLQPEAFLLLVALVFIVEWFVARRVTRRVSDTVAHAARYNNLVQWLDAQGGRPFDHLVAHFTSEQVRLAFHLANSLAWRRKPTELAHHVFDAPRLSDWEDWGLVRSIFSRAGWSVEKTRAEGSTVVFYVCERVPDVVRSHVVRSVPSAP